MVDFSSIGRRVATQVVNNGLQKVAGNVKGLLSGGKKGSDSSDFRDLNTQGSDTKTFQFPLDVTQGPGLGNHGHYIMFLLTNKTRKVKIFWWCCTKNGEPDCESLEEILQLTLTKWWLTPNQVQKNQLYLKLQIHHHILVEH